MTMGDLAVSYALVGRNAEALKLFQETLALQKVKLGAGHPNTLLTMSNVADTYNPAGPARSRPSSSSRRRWRC